MDSVSKRKSFYDNLSIFIPKNNFQDLVQAVIYVHQVDDFSM